MKRLSFLFIFLLTCLIACKDDTPYSPQDLGKLYWKSLERKDFNLTRNYWVSIRELNKLIEIIPELGHQIDKGALYSARSLVTAEKEIFKKVINYTLEEELDLAKSKQQSLDYQLLFKEQGVEVGRIKVSTDFRSKSMKIRLFVVYSNHRWRFLGLDYCRISQTAFEEPLDNRVDI